MFTKRKRPIERLRMQVRIKPEIEDTVRMFAEASGRSVQTEVNMALAQYYAPFQQWKSLRSDAKTKS